MDRWDYFLFLFRQGFVAGNLGCFTFIFCSLFILALYKTFMVDKAPYKKVYLISLIPFLLPIVMLIWGTFFEHTQTYTANVPAWQLNVLSGILFLQFGINLVCLVHFKGIRLSVAALVLLQTYFIFPFYLVAAMSVGGIWL